jgi:hypothetical protein
VCLVGEGVQDVRHVFRVSQRVRKSVVRTCHMRRGPSVKGSVGHVNLRSVWRHSVAVAGWIEEGTRYCCFEK